MRLVVAGDGPYGEEPETLLDGMVEINSRPAGVRPDLAAGRVESP